MVWVKLDCLKPSRKLESCPPSIPQPTSSPGSNALVFPRCEIFLSGTWSMRPLTRRTGTLTHPNVTYDRTAGSPTGRETYGDGGSIVVGGVTPTQGGWESQPQGEGGQELTLDEVRKVCECRTP